MANKNVFKSGQAGQTAPAADTTNKAGGKAYTLSDKAALAQYAATGTFNDTFYSTAEAQVSEVLGILAKVDVEFIGKVAVYARTDGRMKDMPALLCSYLSTRSEDGGTEVLKRIFPLVIDNGKMLRNFVQIMRSGIVGRKSLGTAPKNLVSAWFENHSPADIFKMSVGNDPTIGDVLFMSRSRDLGSPERKAFYAYLLDDKKYEYDFDSLPPLVKEYELLKRRQSNPADASKAELTSLPKVPLEMLMGLQFSEKEWCLLSEQMSWTQLRMNLNTLARHGVFKSEKHINSVALKLSDPVAIERAKPFPYQLLAAYLHTSTTGDEAVPIKIKNALHDALDVATKNTPTFEGQAYIAVDTSGSMKSAVTGNRKGATTDIKCVDVAALIACTFLKKNKESKILPFDTALHHNHGLDPHDSIMTNADRLRKFGGGGTDCGLALAYLNQKKAKGDLVIYISDNESWFDSNRTYSGGWGGRGSGTSMANEWSMYKARNLNAKLICIDLAQDSAVQITSDSSVLNIGGFSDTIWEVIKKFVEGVPSADYWVDVIDKIQLPVLSEKHDAKINIIVL